MFEVWGQFHASQILWWLSFAQKKQLLHFDHHVVDVAAAVAQQKKLLHFDHHIAAAAAVAQQKKLLHFDHHVVAVAAAAVALKKQKLHLDHGTHHCTHQASSLRASQLLQLI